MLVMTIAYYEFIMSSVFNQRLDAVVEDYDNYTDPLDYLKCVGELLYT